jgi:hypothetical protein
MVEYGAAHARAATAAISDIAGAIATAESADSARTICIPAGAAAEAAISSRTTFG